MITRSFLKPTCHDCLKIYQNPYFHWKQTSQICPSLQSRCLPCDSTRIQSLVWYTTFTDTPRAWALHWVCLAWPWQWRSPGVASLRSCQNPPHFQWSQCQPAPGWAHHRPRLSPWVMVAAAGESSQIRQEKQPCRHPGQWGKRRTRCSKHQSKDSPAANCAAQGEAAVPLSPWRPMAVAGCSSLECGQVTQIMPYLQGYGRLRGDVMQVLVLNYAETSLTHPYSEADMVKYPYLKMLSCYRWSTGIYDGQSINLYCKSPVHFHTVRFF